MENDFASKLVECRQNLVYSSFQLSRFFNTSLNSGNQLQPIRVDNMVRVMPYPPFGSDIDPYISEVPYELGSITWSIKDTGQNTSPELSDPVLCFVELYALNSDQVIDEYFLGKYFQLDEHSLVAPNGVLFQTSNNPDKISIDLQKEGGNLLFGYGVVFTIDVKKENQETVTYYCRKDPIVNIRSSDPPS